MRILHIVESLNKGAVETWLVNTYLAVAKIKPDWKWTFYCILPEKGRWDEIVTQSGATIRFSPCTVSQKFKFLQSLRELVVKEKFDIIQAHHDFLSGFYFLGLIGAKKNSNVILHLHNMERGLPTPNEFIKKISLPVFRQSALALSDMVIGNSKATVKDFVGSYPVKSAPFYYGVDFKSKIRIKTSGWLKESLNLQADHKLLLFVGRMYSNKNPAFCVDILNELSQIRQNVSLVYVGEGEDLTKIKTRIQNLNLQDKVYLLGWRNDVFDIMQGCDLLLFPRLETPLEGFGLNILEAQAVGLRSLISFGTPDDVKLLEEGLVYYYRLSHSAAEWAQQANHILQTTPPLTAEQALNLALASKFNIEHCAQNLVNLYSDLCPRE